MVVDSGGTMIRRVVTEEVNGRSRVKSDEPASDLWVTSRESPLGTAPADAFEALEPPSGGSRFRMVSLPPDAVMREILASRHVPGVGTDGFHKTATIDYVIILDGDVTLELDDGSVLLHPGDCVVQRNTNHAWRNHGDAPIRLLAVMVALDR
jgi:mannose-6-phosphate isomerase-like protein (cupin superfamily)